MSPLKSQAQRRWMHARKPAMARRWDKHTKQPKRLPERKRTRKRRR